MNYPKVLVLSIPAWNSGSNTFSVLFEGWPKDKIANIYCRGGLPTSDVCSNYFRINESAVIKSILKKGIKTGDRVLRQQDEAKSTASKKVKHSELLSIIRDLLWKLGKWDSEELFRFVDEFSPDVVLFPIEGYSHFNNIARRIISYKGVPAVGYLWDDNFTYKVHPGNPLFLLRRFFIRRNIRKTVTACKSLLSINEKMKREVKETFGRDSVIITKGIDRDVIPDIRERKKPIKLCYAGKLIIGRDKTLSVLSAAINEVNGGENYFELSVYTQTALSKKQISKLNVSGNVLKGAVSRDELQEIYKDSDILVFAEALSGKHRNAARLSFSTKITDYLSAGKAILALAPRDIAPTEALSKMDSAMIASDYGETVKLLRKLKENPDIINDYSLRSRDLAVSKHNINDIREKLYKELI